MSTMLSEFVRIGLAALTRIVIIYVEDDAAKNRVFAFGKDEDEERIFISFLGQVAWIKNGSAEPKLGRPIPIENSDFRVPKVGDVILAEVQIKKQGPRAVKWAYADEHDTIRGKSLYYRAVVHNLGQGGKLFGCKPCFVGGNIHELQKVLNDLNLDPKKSQVIFSKGIGPAPEEVKGWELCSNPCKILERNRKSA